MSQEFGPSLLTLEPPRVFGGIPFAHFHDAIDLAAPLGSPVVAASRGRVAFVGHLPDGAMVVILVHEGGVTTLYAHLDDAALAPRIRLGDVVEAGTVIGAVGMTGLSTGPHLHFSVRRGTDPIDPRSVLPPR